jgi:NTE family protein
MADREPPSGGDLPDLARRATSIASRPPPGRPLPDDPPHALVDPERTKDSPDDGGGDHSTWKVGLVLAGGAAKGGYQVGAVEALAEAGTRLHAIAGTSIGALNGSVLATAPTVGDGAIRLRAMWERFTAAIGAPPVGGARTDDDDVLVEPFAAQAANAIPRIVRLVLNRGLLEEMVAEAIGPAGLAQALPFYVATYRVLKPIHVPHVRLAQYLVDWMRRVAGNRSAILHLNPLPAEEARNAVLASAALPLMFPARQLRDGSFRDGMLGGDNVPIRALVDAGCRIVIVVHLGQREKIDAREFRDLVLLEVRPSTPLVPRGPLGGLSGPLDFSPERFDLLRQRGYADTREILSELRTVLSTVTLRRAAQARMIDAVAQLDEPVRFED